MRKKIRYRRCNKSFVDAKSVLHFEDVEMEAVISFAVQTNFVLDRLAQLLFVALAEAHEERARWSSFQ